MQDIFTRLVQPDVDPTAYTEMDDVIVCTSRGVST